MPASEEAYGEGHPATYDPPKELETKLVEVKPGEWGYVATTDPKDRIDHIGQLSGIAFGDGKDKKVGVPAPPKSYADHHDV